MRETLPERYVSYRPVEVLPTKAPTTTISYVVSPPDGEPIDVVATNSLAAICQVLNGRGKPYPPRRDDAHLPRWKVQRADSALPCWIYIVK